MNPSTPPDPNAPVAYDAQGRPLYAHPPAQPQPPSNAVTDPDGPNVMHQYVHVTRPMEPNMVDVPQHIKERHDKSARAHPRLNLSEGEYIISAVTRHPIGLIQIWGGALLLIATLAAVMLLALGGGGSGGGNGTVSDQALVLGTLGLVIFSMLIFGGAFIAMYVYNNNRFFLTNESVIQEIQTSLFSRHEQTVSLANIEDASYRQSGLLQYLLNYGTIRLSTEGDETTYRFSYVANPKKHIATLNNAVEAFKNGRPVEPPN